MNMQLINEALNLIKSERINQTSCATALVFDSDDNEQHVFVDIAYVVEQDGAINDAECIFEVPATEENIKTANEILTKIKEKYNIDIFPEFQKTINLEFIHLHGSHDEGLCVYDVSFEDEFTVKEFVQYIIKSRETDYGNFVVNIISQFPKQENMIGKYKNGSFSINNKTFYNEVVNKKVKFIQARGAYSNMDYIILTEDKEFILARERSEKLEHDLLFADEKNRRLIEIVQEKDTELNKLKEQKYLLEQQIAGMKKASLWQRIKGWKE